MFYSNQNESNDNEVEFVLQNFDSTTRRARELKTSVCPAVLYSHCESPRSRLSICAMQITKFDAVDRESERATSLRQS